MPDGQWLETWQEIGTLTDWRGRTVTVAISEADIALMADGKAIFVITPSQRDQLTRLWTEAAWKTKLWEQRQRKPVDG